MIIRARIFWSTLPRDCPVCRFLTHHHGVLSFSHRRCVQQHMTDGFLLSLCLSLFSTLSNSLALLLCRSLLCRVHKRPTMDSLSLFRTRAFSHPLSFARSLALSLSLFHFRAISLSRSLSCRVHKRPTTDSHSLALSLSRSLFRSLALPLSRSLALPFSRSLTLSLSCCLLSRSLALSLSRSLALSLSRSLALSLSRSLALSLSCSLAFSLSCFFHLLVFTNKTVQVEPVDLC